ncbi:hypothetical protein PROFUN_11501 [Planoprotostelium fungivorum]|uniref:Uncharacterized protein n=1 Tax=Planoprotostelium fungivorum TaxID=1890364 RepID=A0A2P6N9X3_9EUKA|nr:hypothetical protein PROFUN_11501 [Planoprotostelium fungivorum]
MNLQLLDPFRNSFPEVIEETLEEGIATTCAFNRRGTLLATGCADGRCIIWDFDTRSVSVAFHGHTHGITSISWSKNGRKMITSSMDWTINYIDVLTGTVEKIIRFESIVASAQMHPKDNNVFVAVAHYEDPVVYNIQTDERFTLVAETGDAEKKPTKGAGRKDNVVTPVAVFNKNGSKIFVGSPRGLICTFDSTTLKQVNSFRVQGGAGIKSIQFSPNGQEFLVNSTDRCIRVFQGENAKAADRSFSDPIDNTQWKKSGWNSDGDYVIGGSAAKSSHAIYIWSRVNGALIKKLEGPKEGITDVLWHPIRPIIVSISHPGIVYVWASNYTENWSAFAPNFKELEENEEYIEREEEFDIVEEEESQPKKKQRGADEQESVDILTVDKISYFSSEDEDDLLCIPIRIQPDPKPSTSVK